MSIIKLKSGREIYTNHGIIGLTPKEDRKFMTLTEGYDGDISPYDLIEVKDKDGKIVDTEYKDWPKEDILEICNIMIARWNEYRNEISLRDK